MNFHVSMIEKSIIVIDCHRSFDFIKDMRAANQMVLDMMRQHKLSSVYRVYNFHDVDIHYNDLFAYMAANSNGDAGSLSDPHIHTVVVGTCQMQQMRVRHLCRDEDDEKGMMVFKTRENAITFCQQHVQKLDKPASIGFFTRLRAAANPA